MAAIVLAGLAAVAVAILCRPQQAAATVALYHLSQDGGPFVNYDNLTALENNIFYPVDAGQYIRWEAIYDGYESPVKVVPGWDVEVGKDAIGLYHRNPYGSGTRVSVSSPEENRTWLSSL